MRELRLGTEPHAVCAKDVPRELRDEMKIVAQWKAEDEQKKVAASA